MDGGHQLFPETFLLQRDSNQVQKNTKDCVGRDLLIVQNAAYRNSDFDDLRQMI